MCGGADHSKPAVKVLDMKQIQTRKNCKMLSGASLMELLISIFVFVLIVVAASAIITSSLNNRKAVQKMQKDYDQSSVVLNEIAKVLSTADFAIGTTASNNTSSVTVYSASQNACIQYAFSGNRISQKEQFLEAADTPDDCDSAGSYLSSTSSQVLVDANVQGHFLVDPEVSGSHAASATIFIEIIPDITNAGQNMFLQTTVALRKSIAEF